MAEQRVDIEIRTTADTSGVNQAEQALRKVDTAAKQAGTGTAAAGQAAKTASADIRGLSQAGAGLNQAMNGLSQGGVSGLITTFRGLSAVAKGLATGVFGTVLLGALGAAATAIAYLTNVAEKNRAAIKKMYEDGAANAKAYEERVKEVKASAERALESQLRVVERLTGAYKELIASMDEAESRMGKLRSAEQQMEISQIDRDEALALSKATTDQERESIRLASASKRAAVNQKYGSASLDSELLNTKVREENANRAIADASAQQFEADKAVAAAQQKYDYERSRIGQNAQPEDLVAAKAAKAALDAALANQTKVRESLAPVISAAESEIARVQQTRALVPIQQRTFANQTETERLGRQTSYAGRGDAERAATNLDTRYNQLWEESKSLTPGWENERSAQIDAEMSRIAAERDAAYRAIGDFAATETKARADLERQLINASESSAGR